MDLVDTLQRAGYHTIEASSADEALEILEREPGICCLFTDIQMPGSMDGLELVERVKLQWPDKYIVIGSGNVQDPILSGTVFLPKPYDLDHLTSVIDAMHGHLDSAG